MNTIRTLMLLLLLALSLSVAACETTKAQSESGLVNNPGAPMCNPLKQTCN
jgi:hypothetical protein